MHGVLVLSLLERLRCMQLVPEEAVTGELEYARDLVGFWSGRPP